MNIDIIKFTNIDVICYMTTMMAYKYLPYMTLPSRITAIYTLLWYSKKVNHTAMYREKHLLKSLWPSDPICVFLSKGVSWSNPAGSANLNFLSKAVCVLLREISADPGGISWAHLNQRPLTIKLLSFFLLKYTQKTIYYNKWYAKTRQNIYLYNHQYQMDVFDKQWQMGLISLCVCLHGILLWHKLLLWCQTRFTMRTIMATI